MTHCYRHLSASAEDRAAMLGPGAIQGDAVLPHLAMLGALLAAALIFAPWAIAASLRISING